MSVAAMLSGCAKGVKLIPVPTLSPSPTPTPTISATPTGTPTNSATPTKSATPSPSATPVHGSWTSVGGAHSGNLRSIDFVSENEGWIVGEHKIVYHSTDSGSTWNSVDITSTGVSPDAHLNDVLFVNQNIGYIALDSSASITYIKTTDEGATWIPKAIEGSGNHIFFIGTQEGWIADAHIRKTIDGAVTWLGQDITIDGHYPIINDVFIISPEGWVAGQNGTIGYWSGPGATEWISQESHTSEDLSSIYCISSHEGWAAGNNGAVIHTSNGITWEAQAMHTSTTFNGIYFVSSKEGFIAADNGIWHTIDGGNNWSQQYYASFTKMRSIFFYNHDINQGWACGEGGIVLRYTP